MKKLYERVKEPIPFKVSDMLRGKCLFASVENINQCCSDIIEALSNDFSKTVRVVEIDNRLRKGTSDLVLKILYGDVIAEMQLVINLNAADYEFSHKLYELQRCKLFTPLTQLAIANEDISIDYLSEALAVITAHPNGREVDDYREAVSI